MCFNSVAQPLGEQWHSFSLKIPHEIHNHHFSSFIFSKHEVCGHKAVARKIQRVHLWDDKHLIFLPDFLSVRYFRFMVHYGKPLSAQFTSLQTVTDPRSSSILGTKTACTKSNIWCSRSFLIHGQLRTYYPQTITSERQKNVDWRTLFLNLLTFYLDLQLFLWITEEI